MNTDGSFVISQALVSVAFLIGLAAVQFKPRRTVLLLLAISTGFNAVHFLLLERPGASVVIGLTGIRYLTAIVTTSKRAMWFFISLNVIAFLVTYQNPQSFLALSAVLMGTYGSFLPADRNMRQFFMAGNTLWLIHNVLVFTPIGMLMEASFLTSNFVGYVRFYGPFAKDRFVDDRS